MALPAGMRSIPDFDGSRDSPLPAERLRAVRRAATGFRERFLAEPEVLFYQSIDLVRAPYPLWYAYSGVYSQSALNFPLLHLLNRLFVIQYRDFDGVLRTLLFSPSDAQANARTPFFQRLSDRLPSRLRRLGKAAIAPMYRSVPEALSDIGLLPAQVDYLSYDHLHTQDVRRWLGSDGQPGLFPNARLLVHAQEWASASALLPLQADWYCPQGLAGVPADKVVTFEGSLALGPGLALLHTPGHTEGNHSLAARVPDGIRVTSENGVGADAYAPLNSRINAVRRYARDTGVEVILNGNTLEGSCDQYLSMVLEKTVAGPSHHPDYPNCASSSEATPYWLFPGPRPSLLFGETCFGSLQWQS